jgi:hypothetical protein
MVGNLKVIRKKVISSGTASGSVVETSPHPDPHQRDKLDPDPHQFAGDKPKCMGYEPLVALFHRFEPLFGR